MIDNFRAPNFRVWNDNVLVVECDHICRKQCDRVHFPECTARFDEIAHFIRTKQDQHVPAARLAKVPCNAKPTARPAAPKSATSDAV